MASVVSAAVISGELIIGLDDGSIIRAGYVQGPQGLKGDQGPMGATGGSGQDGNTIHTVEGTPDGSLGKDGDYAINRVEWRIHGPKAGGRWPQGVDMLAKGKSKGLGGKGSGGNGIITGGGSGGGPTGDVFTNTVIASGTGRLAEVPRNNSPFMAVTYPGSPLGMIPQRPSMAYQSNINAWIVDALEALEVNIPVFIADLKPTGPGTYDGMLYFDSSEDDLTLYIRYNDEWVPAAPPVSTEGIESNITLLQEVTDDLQRGLATTAIKASEEELKVLDLQESQAAQDARLDALEGSSSPDLSGYVAKAGDAMTGTLQINGALDNKIDPLLCRADGYYMSFGVTKDGEVFAGASTANPFLATANWHVVTKGYLDTQIPTAAQIAEASLGRRFKLGTWDDVVNSGGEPGWLDTGQGSSAASNWIAMSLVDLDGLKVHQECEATGDFDYGIELPFTMYAYINDEWEVVAGGKARSQTDCKDNRFQLSEVTWGKFYSSTSNRNQIVRLKVGGLW